MLHTIIYYPCAVYWYTSEVWLIISETPPLLSSCSVSYQKCNIFYQTLLMMNSVNLLPIQLDLVVKTKEWGTLVCLLLWAGPVSILGYSSYMDHDLLHLLPPLPLLNGWEPSPTLSLSSSASLVHYNFYPGDTYWSVRQLSLGRQSKIRLLWVHNKFN